MSTPRLRMRVQVAPFSGGDLDNVEKFITALDAMLGSLDPPIWEDTEYRRQKVGKEEVTIAKEYLKDNAAKLKGGVYKDFSEFVAALRDVFPLSAAQDLAKAKQSSALESCKSFSQLEDGKALTPEIYLRRALELLHEYPGTDSDVDKSFGKIFKRGLVAEDEASGILESLVHTATILETYQRRHKISPDKLINVIGDCSYCVICESRGDSSQQELHESYLAIPEYPYKSAGTGQHRMGRQLVQFCGGRTEDSGRFVIAFLTAFCISPPLWGIDPEDEQRKITLMQNFLTGKASEMMKGMYKTFQEFLSHFTKAYPRATAKRFEYDWLRRCQISALGSYISFSQIGEDGENLTPEEYLRRADGFRVVLPANLHRVFAKIFLRRLVNQDEACQIRQSMSSNTASSSDILTEVMERYRRMHKLSPGIFEAIRYPIGEPGAGGPYCVSNERHPLYTEGRWVDHWGSYKDETTIS